MARSFRLGIARAGIALLLTLAPTTAARAQTPVLSPQTAVIEVAAVGGSGSTTITLIGAPNAPWSAALLPPSGVNMSVTPSSGTLPPSGRVDLLVQASNVAQAGVARLLVTHRADLVEGTIVLQVHSASISITPTVASVAMPQPLTPRVFTWTLRNLSSAAVQVNLALGTDGGWPTQLLAPSSVVLPIGGSAPVPISVTRPAGATGRHVVRLLALPQGSGQGYATAVATFGNYPVFFPVVQTPRPLGVDAYEPDNSCAQFSALAQGEIQSRTYFTGGAGADTDVIRVQLAGGTQPITYFVRFRGTGAATQPRLTFFYASQACGVGATVTYTSTNGAHVNVPIRLQAGSAPYSFTLWISSTNATGAWGASEAYTVALSLPVAGAGSALSAENFEDGSSSGEEPILVLVGE